jgi:hypothetical protein
MVARMGKVVKKTFIPVTTSKETSRNRFDPARDTRITIYIFFAFRAMSAPEGFSISGPDSLSPVATGPMGERRLLELRGYVGATVFGLHEPHERRAGWDRFDLLTIMGAMRRTRTLWGLDPAMDDRTLAEVLRVQADIAADSPLPRSERFARATYGYHELCIRVFGEYPYRFDPCE